jgi:hypothetical protein
MGLILLIGVLLGFLVVVLESAIWLDVAGVCAVVVCALAAHVVYAGRGRRQPESFRSGILLPPRPSYAIELLVICLVGAAGCAIVGVGSLVAEDGVRRAALLLIGAPGLLVLAGFLAMAITRRRGGLLLEPTGLTIYPFLSRTRTVSWRDVFEVTSDPLWDGWIGLRMRDDEEIKIGITAVALPAKEVMGLVSRYATTPADRSELASLERFNSI